MAFVRRCMREDACIGNWIGLALHRIRVSLKIAFVNLPVGLRSGLQLIKCELRRHLSVLGSISLLHSIRPCASLAGKAIVAFGFKLLHLDSRRIDLRPQRVDPTFEPLTALPRCIGSRSE